MKGKVVLLAGGTGLIGRYLKQYFKSRAYEVRVLSRFGKGEGVFEWNTQARTYNKRAFEDVNLIVNLSGEGIAAKPWTREQKTKIIESRKDAAFTLQKAIVELNLKPECLIQLTAIGFYGSGLPENDKEEGKIETDEAGIGFLAESCMEWEKAGHKLLKMADRAYMLRTGLVLSKTGGVLAKLIKPVNWYAGAVLGSGRQAMPWIHIEDLARIIEFMANGKAEPGIYNAVAPARDNHIVFMKQLTELLNRPLWPVKVPAFMLKLLLGEMSEMVTGGPYVSAKKILSYNYDYKFTDLKSALQDLYK